MIDKQQSLRCLSIHLSFLLTFEGRTETEYFIVTPVLKEMFTVSITCNLYINLNVLHNCRWLQTLGPLWTKYIFCWVTPHISSYWVINLPPLLRERVVVRDWWRQGFPICEVLLATTDGLWLSVRYKAAYGSHYFIIESICSQGKREHSWMAGCNCADLSLRSQWRTSRAES